MEEKTLLQATVCFLRRNNEVLLARKTKKIGAGCWNGYGGGIESGENPEQAALRELAEETRNDQESAGGITARIEDLQKVAVVDFHNTKADGTIFVCCVHFYFVFAWKGEAEETDEMAEPTWFDVNHLPFDEMMPADREFVPLLLAGKKVRGTVWYGPFQKELLRQTEIVETDQLG